MGHTTCANMVMATIQYYKLDSDPSEIPRASMSKLSNQSWARRLNTAMEWLYVTGNLVHAQCVHMLIVLLSTCILVHSLLLLLSFSTRDEPFIPKFGSIILLRISPKIH